MKFPLCLVLLSGIFAICSAAPNASAQLAGAASITGRVVDTNGKPVSNAAVSLVQLGIETRTDSDGRFTFTGTPAADYTITVRRAGLAARTVNHVHPGYSLAEIVLTRSPFVIDPVTVTAARGATEVGSSVLPVNTLSEEMIRRDATISIAHSLIRLPGVRSVSTGEQIGKPMIRGFYGARVLTLENGSRLEDYSWSEEDAPSVDARLAQRVEVIRGPASVLYGSDAMGGVVNVIPQDLPVAAQGQSFRRIGGELYGASNNLETGGALNAEGASGRFGWRATGIGRLAQSYDTPAGEVEHTGFFSINGEVAAGIRRTNSNTTLRVSHYGGEFKLLEARGPGSGPSIEGEEEEGPERKLADERVQLVHDQFMGNLRLQTKAQFQRHSLVEVSDDLCLIAPSQCEGTIASASEGEREQTAFDLLLNTGTLDILGHTSFGSTDRFVAGVSGLFQKNDSRGPIFLIPDATTHSEAAFIFEEATFGRFGIAGGARIDFRNVSADANPSLGLSSPEDRSWTQPSGNFGLVLHATPQISLRANAGAAWRAPTLFELYANGPHLAEGRYEIGDQGLDPEKAINLDVGLRWQNSRASAEISGFRNKISEFIYITPTNEFRNDLRVFRHLSADALLTGGEASAQFFATPNFIIRARHDFVRGTNEDLDSPLPLMPPPRTAGGAEYHFNTASFGDVFVAGEVENVLRQKRPSEFDVVTAGYTLLNFDFGFHYSLFGRPARVDLGIRNAADRKYRSFLSRYKEFALEPGRNIMLRVSTTP